MAGEAKQRTSTGLGLRLDATPASADDGSRDVPGIVGDHNDRRANRETEVHRRVVLCPVGVAPDFEWDALGLQALLQCRVGAAARAFGVLAKGTRAKGRDEEERRNVHGDDEEDW